METRQGADGKFVGVVMLHKAPIDKIMAKALYGRAAGRILPIAEFYASSTCSREQMERWIISKKLIPIDIGDDKYHSEKLEFKAGSATELAAILTKADTDGPVGELVRLANENNRTGKLKRQYLSIAWVVREFYELPDYDQREIIARTEEVVHAFLRGLEQDNFLRSDAGMRTELPDLAEKTAKCNGGPFTVGRYFRDLWRSEMEISIIREKILWWISAFDSVRRATEKAETEFRRMNRVPDEFSVRAGKFVLKGFFLRTADKCLARIAAKAYDVLVVENGTTGHLSVMTPQFGLSNLAGELIRREGREIWFYEERQGMLLNGGLIYNGNPRSSLGRNIIPIIQQHPPRVPSGYHVRKG